MERTLVFIKPDGVERGLIGEVIKRFESRGIQIQELKQLTMSPEQVDTHYQEHLERPFYPDLKTYILSGPVVVMILAADNVVSIVRTMVGATNAGEAAPGTIRGDLALNTANNIVHASDSTESAEREIKNFF